MSGEPVLEAYRLARRFDSVTALDGVTFSIPAGQVVGLLGHNGAGKTTTIRLLNGLLAPTGGRVATLGLDPSVDGPSVRARTGVLTETPSLDDRMTARESMTFWADMWGVEPRLVAARVSELLERFDLEGRADDSVGGYSRGMGQRLAIARTLLHDPPLLFLDEPTAALDPIAALGVRELVRSLAADGSRTILVCTHNLAEAQELCDRVMILRHGRLVADGTPAEVADTAALPVRVRLEVDGGQTDVALRVAGSRDGVRALADGPGRITIEGLGQADVPALVAELVGAGASVYRVNPEAATLEDAYVALYGAEAEGER